MLGVDAERDLVDLSYYGVAYGALASLFVTLNAIYTTQTLPYVDHNVWKLGNLEKEISYRILLFMVYFIGLVIGKLPSFAKLGVVILCPWNDT